MKWENQFHSSGNGLAGTLPLAAATGSQVPRRALQLCLQLARTSAASPRVRLPASCAWPCLQRRQLLGADPNPEPALMTATAHGPTAAALYNRDG